ncbi:MAG: DUF308 domain-containing protein [Synergistaceae bacterium]|jgi:uncharacterized membrane protein HdeD (DUF308 family)|nr:DUF308 domain-containing protein [Synergistaceae bacterium]
MAYNFNKTARWTFYTAGVIFVALGLLSAMRPVVALISTAISMGVGFILAGINNLVPYFTMRGNPLRPNWLLPLGLLDVLFGVFFLSHIGFAIFTITTLLGVWVLLSGCLRLYISIQIKAAGIAKWWLMLASAAVMLLLSAALLSHPQVEGIILALLTGLSLIGLGIMMIAEGRIIYPDEQPAA